MELHLHIENKIAKNLTPDGVIVCGNKDYEIAFTFDEEWAGHDVKTARFAYNGKYEDVVLTGGKCTAPAIYNASSVSVGVFAGDLRTTTPARITCKRSILCENGLPADPVPDVYTQIIALVNKYVEVGAMTREELIALIGDETADLQGKIDDALATSDKSIVGAINEVLGLASDNKNNIANAVETASNAKTVADDAKQAAQGAEELANTANATAAQALETANASAANVSYAVETAQSASEKAENALNTANGAKEIADTLSETITQALNLANTAFEQSGTAQENAQTALDKSIAVESKIPSLGATLRVSLNSSDFKLTIELVNLDGVVLSTHTVDMPLETMVVGGAYDTARKMVVLTLQNGQKVEFGIADLIDGLVSQTDFDALAKKVDENKTATDKAIADALQEAKDYTDVTDRNAATYAETAEKNAKGYTDSVCAQLESNANSYTDERVETAKNEAITASQVKIVRLI